MVSGTLMKITDRNYPIHINLLLPSFDNDAAHIADEINKAKIETIGTIDSTHFVWPINREQSLTLLDFSVKNCLPLFGTFQDAMAPNEWSVYHSRLSFSLNLKLISPQEVVNKAIETYYEKQHKIAFHQLEGFL
jgi:deoxyribodipyrimidine photolyase-related protein